MTPDEVSERGWDSVDVVFVTGDAYVDHPSFAMAILGRHLESHGYRVAILSQPDWRSCEAWRSFGRPQICFAVGAGNMDSMVNHYTANRKVRNDDAYSPDGRAGRRPDRATLAYCQRSREAYRGVPVVVGGIEASLRRLAHYELLERQGPAFDNHGRQARSAGLRYGRADAPGNRAPFRGRKKRGRIAGPAGRGISAWRQRHHGAARGNRKTATRHETHPARNNLVAQPR